MQHQRRTKQTSTMFKTARGIEWEDSNSSSHAGTALTFSASPVSMQASTSRKHQRKRKSVFDEGKQCVENPSVSWIEHFQTRMTRLPLTPMTTTIRVSRLYQPMAKPVHRQLPDWLFLPTQAVNKLRVQQQWPSPMRAFARNENMVRTSPPVIFSKNWRRRQPWRKPNNQKRMFHNQCDQPADENNDPLYSAPFARRWNRYSYCFVRSFLLGYFLLYLFSIILHF